MTREEHIARARAAKAARLARVCRLMIEDCGALSASSFADVPDDVRRRIEETAGVPRSSDETWKIVHTILRSTELHPDPFEGIAP